MTIDMQSVQGLLTAFAAVVAALVSLWNAWQATKLKTAVEETNIELKALKRRR